MKKNLLRNILCRQISPVAELRYLSKYHHLNKRTIHLPWSSCHYLRWSSTWAIPLRIASYNSMSPYKMNSSLKLDLSEKEEEICNLLLETTRHIAKQYPELPPVCLRVAGGWVRDKLLGLDSHDMDIAIDTMKGEQFAQHLKEYMVSQGHHMGTIATIQVNPEKSKHLETATGKVLDHDLDFVHLRTEIYEDHSRNPIVEFGSPLEDALRRDITINALFYNLHSRQVEDFTKKGLDDLKNGVIRTPLPPRQTFLDDPLRLLRVIRFATRFGFRVDSETLNSMGADDIDDALKRKISKERIGVEVDKMAQGKDPVGAIRLMCETNLYPIVFEPPKAMDPDVSLATVKSNAWHYCSILDSTLRTISSQMTWISFNDSPNSELLKYCILASWVAPFQGVVYFEKARPIAAVRYIMIRSVKLSNLEGDYVSALLKNAKTISSMARSVFDNPEAVSRVKLGLLVRELGSRPLEDDWDLAVLLALSIDLCNLIRNNSPETFHAPKLDNNPAVTELIKMYDSFMRRIKHLSLEKAHHIKPLLDGKEIAQLLKEKPGKKIGIYLAKVLEWQLEFPNGAKEECIEWLQGAHSQMRI